MTPFYTQGLNWHILLMARQHESSDTSPPTGSSSKLNLFLCLSCVTPPTKDKVSLTPESIKPSLRTSTVHLHSWSIHQDHRTKTYGQSKESKRSKVQTTPTLSSREKSVYTNPTRLELERGISKCHTTRVPLVWRTYPRPKGVSHSTFSDVLKSTGPESSNSNSVDVIRQLVRLVSSVRCALPSQ